LNKEVAAASESIDSIIGDLVDKWEAYVLSTNDANSGTQALTKTLKFVRDNFKEIIDFVLKASAVFFTYLGVVKTVNFVIAASTALQTGWTAGQIRFALATGIGTKSILAQAEAAKAATVAQEGLNIATKATPWGLIIGLVSAAVVAYVAFNDTLSETEKRIKAVNDAQKKVQDSENFYISERDKNREKDFKAIEDEIALRRAKGENSKKLDEEEINRKIQIINAQKEVVKALDSSEIDRTKKQIEESDKRVAQMQKEYDEINSLALRNPFGESIKEKKIVSQDLMQLKNSDLFKYSPYTALTEDQMEIADSIYHKIVKGGVSNFVINGGAGTGKTILALYLIKMLKEKEGTSTMSIALVVSMTSLRKTLKKVFSRIKSLKGVDVIGPSDVVKKDYDILVVDESHRLKTRKNNPAMGAFDNVNRKLGLDINFGTQLHWILKKSKYQIFFYDSEQSVYPADIGKDVFEELFNGAFHYKLNTQLRVEGGND
jgi:DNA replication protein DnaC